jgi:hypothetical protein
MDDFSDSIFSGGLPSLVLKAGSRRKGAAVLDAGAARKAAASLTQRSRAEPAPEKRRLLEGLALLWHDHWDEAHEIAQSHEGESDHDLLHAILHRREGDFANAGYWFGQAGKHPCYAGILPRLAAFSPGELAAAGIGREAWSPKAFLASVRKAAEKEAEKGPQAAESAAVLTRMQAEEFRAFAAFLLQS